MMFSFIACNSTQSDEGNNIIPTPTNTKNAVSPTQEPTNAVTPTATADSTAIANPTASVTATATAKPGSTTTPTATVKPGVASTQKPTATVKPTVTVKPTAVPEKTAKPTDTPSPYANLRVYDIITFGKYEQDNNNANGPEDIRWFVLAIKEGKALVLSVDALECMEYNSFLNRATWEVSTSRNWLNGYFFRWAFSDEEKAKIPTVTVTAEQISNYPTGNDTQDKVFLFSKAEIEEYVPLRGAPSIAGPYRAIRGCNLTEYAKANSSRWNYTSYGIGWWLRTASNNTALYVTEIGASVPKLGEIINSTDLGIRPAMWIDLS